MNQSTVQHSQADVEEIQRTPQGYLNYVLRGSEKRHLLVEGKDDRNLFIRLFGLLDPNYQKYVLIDLAERIRPGPEHPTGASFGMRDRVVVVSGLARDRHEGDRFVGFVDREYTDFHLDPALIDLDPDHKVDGRLVRARGHSAENYLFDFAAFARPLRLYLPDQIETTIGLFERVFDDAIRIACAVGLSCLGHPAGNFTQAIQNAPVKWASLTLDSGTGLRLDTQSWRQELLGRSGFPSGWVDSVLAKYPGTWERVQSAPQQVVRWACHGHIGLSLLWSAFARCVYEQNGHLREQDRTALAGTVLQARHDIRLRSVVDNWANNVLGGTAEWPGVLIEMLGLRSNVPLRA